MKTVVKTAGCDVDCVQKCTQTPRYYSYKVTPEEGKYYANANASSDYKFNGTHITGTYYKDVA